MTTKLKSHQYLQNLITANPGISRTLVFGDAELRKQFLSQAARNRIDAGDTLEIKRYNRRLNRFIRQIRRDGVEIGIERVGRVAHYTIAEGVQLELPFDLKAEARNSFKIGPVDTEELAPASPIAAQLLAADDEGNALLDFESLLAELDEEAVAPLAE